VQTLPWKFVVWWWLEAKLLMSSQLAHERLETGRADKARAGTTPVKP
jgi:hypothetical protein